MRMKGVEEVIQSHDIVCRLVKQVGIAYVFALQPRNNLGDDGIVSDLL